MVSSQLSTNTTLDVHVLMLSSHSLQLSRHPTLDLRPLGLVFFCTSPNHFSKRKAAHQGSQPRCTASFVSDAQVFFSARHTNQHLNAHAHIRPTEPVSTKFRSSRCARSVDAARHVRTPTVEPSRAPLLLYY